MTCKGYYYYRGVNEINETEGINQSSELPELQLAFLLRVLLILVMLLLLSLFTSTFSTYFLTTPLDTLVACFVFTFYRELLLLRLLLLERLPLNTKRSFFALPFYREWLLLLLLLQLLLTFL